MSDFPKDLVLHTERLCLRPLESRDADRLWPDIADPEISRFMAWDAHTDRAQTAAFVEHEIRRCREGRGVTWAIEFEDRVCGIISLIGILRAHRSLTYDKAELAYWLSRSLHRRGLMTEAGRRVLDFGFRDLALHKVHVSHFGVNEASQALIERLGFRYVGTQEQEFRKAGTWYDHAMYELLDSEFDSL